MANKKTMNNYMKTESQTFTSFNVNGFPWMSLNFGVVLFILISASLLQALEKQQEALVHFREAVKLAPCNFEAQKGNQSCCLLKDIITCVCSFIFMNFVTTVPTGLVECYMASNRHKEALTVAKNAHKTMGANPRTLTV